MEIWKNIPGYNNYQASTYGNIRSLNYLGHGKIKKLKYTTIKGGYFRLGIYKNGKREYLLVHKLIAITFLGESNLEINHNNGIKTDNHLENLEYCTAKENTLHKYYTLGVGNIKKVNQYTLDGNFIKTWDSVSLVSKKLKLNRTSIQKCANGFYKKSGGYIWKYK